MRRRDPELLANIVEYIGRCVISESYMPTVREVGRVFGISKSTAHNYMTLIESEGLCPKLDKFAKDDVVSASWLDNDIACGEPTYQEQNIREYVQLPAAIFGRGEKYILTASGDSMIEAGIEEGDILIIRKQVWANDGDIVVGLLNGGNTLNTLMHHEDGRPYLHPENSKYSDIEFSEDDVFYIQGVLSHVIKNYEELQLGVK